MDINKIRTLIDTLVEKGIEEFELEEGDLRIRIRRAGASVPASVPVTVVHTAAATAPPAAVSAPAPQPAPVAVPAAAEETPEEAGLFIVRSPIVGTFYESPSPGSPEFAKVGDNVEVGQVLCIIEAMKLMNEIEAEVAGQIVRRYVANAQPVEYGQSLFAIRPVGK
jgi:acetyl-CoA carboxylase biotin carboxyl carrier protein